MDKTTELFVHLTNGLNKTLVQTRGSKICVPLSAGLDSRFLMGLCGNIADLVFTIDYGNERNTGYAVDIAHTIGQEIQCIKMTDEQIQKDKHVIAKLPNPEENMRSGNWTALRMLNERVNLKDYVVLVPYDLDVWTGIKVNPLTLFKYKRLDEIQKARSESVNKPQLRGVWASWFNNAFNPFDDQEIIDYCLSLPLRDRFHQRLYRRMIDRYFPNIASIPRENLHVAPNVNEVRYTWAKIKKYLKIV